MKRSSILLKSAAVALALSLPVAGALSVTPTAVFAATTLPAPYVSRALDAVLMPVDATVVQTFGLAAGTTGVMVIATDPSGLAAAAGIEPGDVIDYIRGEAVLTPIELDEIIYYWIKQGAFDFDLRAKRGGKPYAAKTTVTLEAWETVIDITTVSTWASYSYESFSYSEYYSEYSEEITSSYESSETTIEESTTSEEFQSDMQAEDEGYADEVAADEATGDEATADEGTGDEATAEDGSAEECDPAVNPDCADPAADEGAADDGADDGADAGGDDGGDAGGDDGGDAGGDEEIVE